MPKAGHGAIDDTWIDLAQAFVIIANGFHAAGAEVFQHEIAHGDQLVDDLMCLLALHIEVDAIFTAVVPVPVAAGIEAAILKGKGWGVPPDTHPFAPLDLNHLLPQSRPKL